MADMREMLKSHPQKSGVDVALLSKCVDDVRQCAQICTACADACLGEQEPRKLVRCIRTDLDCADVCSLTARVLSRQTETVWELTAAQLRACVTACRLCAQECDYHAKMHDHCRLCADTCRRCESSCNDMLKALPSAS